MAVPRRSMAVTAVLGVMLLAGCTRTTIPGVQVRTGPTTGSPSAATIPEVDTHVRVQCWTRGERVNGDPVWYRITRPDEGYVTNYYVRTSADYANAPPC